MNNDSSNSNSNIGSRLLLLYSTNLYKILSRRTHW
nr:MAG TPA: hypothetical protein [Caudoviricetes sp.]